MAVWWCPVSSSLAPLPPGSRLLFAGSRSLPRSFAPLVVRVVAWCLVRGFVLAVGCASGADRFALLAALPRASSLWLFAVGSSSGAGFAGRASSPLSLLSRVASSGARVSWWSGGGASVPLRARLALRARAAAAASSGGVFFFSSPSSRGSLLAAAALAGRACPVFVFSCGFSSPPAALPGLAGFWVASSLAGFACWRWSPSSVQLGLGL